MVDNLGHPIRLNGVQLGASLAGKLSSELISIASRDGSGELASLTGHWGFIFNRSLPKASWLSSKKTVQSPAPGFGEKYWSLSGLPSHSLESAGGARLTVIFGQVFA